MSFKVAFCATLREESGLEQVWGQPIRRGRYSYMDHPKDPGGATMCGVTHRVYDAWRIANGKPKRDVREIEDDEIIAIYRENYWNAVPCGKLPSGVDVAVYDMAVHSGPARAVKILQRVLGVQEDGHLGVVTLTAVNGADKGVLVKQYMDARRKYIRSLRNYEPFAKGWEARMDRIETMALTNAYIEPSPNEPQEQRDNSIPVTEIVQDASEAGRAYEAQAKSMKESSTAQAATIAGGLGTAQVGVEAAQAIAKVRATPDAGFIDMLLELAMRPALWGALSVVVVTAYIWIERRRKLESI